MAAIWDDILVLDLTLPSNGPLTSGSGTVYLGGPRLPAELKALGVSGAVVWYSKGVQSNIWQYSFIANTPTDGFIQGQVDANGVVWNVFTYGQAGTSLQPNLTVSTSSLTLDVENSLGPGSVYFTANNSLNYGLQIDTGVAPGPCIKAVNSTGIDVWSGNYTATAVNIDGRSACETRWNWYLSPDYRCELHWEINTTVGVFPTVAFLTVPIPAGLNLPQPHAQTSPVEGGYGPGVMNSLSTNARIDSGTGNMFVFTNGLVGGTIGNGTFTYQVDKP